MSSPSEAPARRRGPSLLFVFLVGILAGVALSAVALWRAAPSLMIVTEPGAKGFDETVAAVQEALAAKGWKSPSTMDMNATLAKHGQELGPRVKVIQLCQPAYAREILETDRQVACMMPCSIAVWEDDQGAVQVSKINSGVIGKLFGGNISRVMGDKVSKEVDEILAAVR